MTGLGSLVRPVVRFGTEPAFQQEVSSLISSVRGGPVTCHPIGDSEQGRQIMGYVIGNGPIRVSLIAGSHSDEPVGPETLRALVRGFILSPERLSRYVEQFTFVVIPHVNPDGEARNQPWIRRWPSLEAYLEHAFRELPGRDMEFGYPGLRRENKLVSELLADHGPYRLHASLHGMGFSDGALLLIDRHWAGRAEVLKERFRGLAAEHGMKLHDHDRGGEKGFEYLGPGFTTTPRGEAMRAHFLSAGDPETASLFHDSSMEYARSLGGDPLCLVTELPLFLIGATGAGSDTESVAGLPSIYLKLKRVLPQAKLAVANGRSAGPFLDEFDLSPVPVATAVGMQMEVIQIGLDATLQPADS